MYVRVAVDTDAASYLDAYSYQVPEELADRVKLGAAVLVPFGTSQVIGYVVGFEDTPAVERIRAILAVIDSPITLGDDLIELAAWMSRRYVCGLSRCAHSALPGVIQCKVKGVVELLDASVSPDSSVVTALVEAGGSLPLESVRAISSSTMAQVRKLEKSGALVRHYVLVPPEGKELLVPAVELAISHEAVESEIHSLSRSPKRVAVLRYVLEHGTGPTSKICAETGVTASVVAGLVTKGILRRTKLNVRRGVAHTLVASTAHYELTPAQQGALDAVVEGIDTRAYGTTLLHGVTASGKTEVYLRAIEHATALGQRSLVLLPEISLTAQVLNIFRTRFGDRVAVLHSGLSAGERFDEWTRSQNGEVDIVLGARSAIFAPVDNLGLVIVDEEHEPSYKQDSDPRYHGRDVALQRARQSGALAVLGSATPAIESYYLAKAGKYRLVALKERIANRPLPKVEITDLRDEFQKGKATIFTERLTDGIKDRLGRGHQVILFQNRRAYATFLLCRECGYTATCPNCSVSLKLHAAEKMTRCHHCDYEHPAPSVCPTCGGMKIGKFGIGTERIEEEVRSVFPEARVLRMDRDTTTHKGSHGAILDAFRHREADILVGTQMIAKGLDFPGVTLVGVISADTSLNVPDFRAGERTFQLLSQVAGRAGRGTDPGEVVVQTFNPDHYAVVAAAAHDYESFYEQEIEIRRELSYPPFSAIVNVVAADSDENQCRKRLNELADRVTQRRVLGGAPIDVRGPVPASVAKLRGEYRWHVIFQSPDRGSLMRALRSALDALPSVRRKVVVDVDPSTML